MTERAIQEVTKRERWLHADWVGRRVKRVNAVGRIEVATLQRAMIQFFFILDLGAAPRRGHERGSARPLQRSGLSRVWTKICFPLSSKSKKKKERCSNN